MVVFYQRGGSPMKIHGRIIKSLMRLALAFLLIFAFLNQAAYAFTINFDSVEASAEGIDATSYLAGFGITLSNVTSGTGVYIIKNTDSDWTNPSSLPNYIAQRGSNDPVSYTLTFATPLADSGFTRTEYYCATGIAYPEWWVQAFNESGVGGTAVHEFAHSVWGTEPAKVYSLTVPSGYIKSVVVSSDNHHFAAFNAVLLDDFQGTPVPAPSTVLLLGSALAALGVLRARRRA